MSKRQNLIPKYIEQFFKACEIDEKLNSYSFFLIRHDGVVLYHNDNSANQLSKSSIGALLGGVWQAAHALASFIPQSPEKNQTDNVYRLSFDTASQGVYVVPAKVYNEEFYLGLIYYGELNPGVIKNKVRNIASSFSEYMEEELKAHPLATAAVKSKKNNDYLFNDISDVEMDQAFASLRI
jgi:hypothetical protein